MSRSPEDALREALQAGADPAEPGGSFDDVRARARRLDRRSAAAKAAVGLAAVLAIVAISIPLLRSDDEQPVISEPSPPTTTPTTTSTSVPVGQEPLGLWPYVTGEDADRDELADELPFDAADPVATADAFLRTVGGIEAGRLEQRGVTDDREREVVAEVGPVPRRTTVVLRRLGTSERWTVVEARAGGVVLDQPAPGAEVTSPLTVAGQATAFEGTVQLRVLDRRGLGVLAETFATGEAGVLRPFTGEVPFSESPSGLGMLVATTESAEDGSVEEISARAIRWSVRPPESPAAPAVVLPKGEPLAHDEVIAVLTHPGGDDPDDHVVVVLGLEGQTVRRQLYSWGAAEGGVLDVAVSADGRTVLLALGTSACESSLVALAADGVGGGLEPTDLGAGEVAALSPDERWLAVAVDDDCDGQDTLEVRDLTGASPTRRHGDGAADTRGLQNDAMAEDGLVAGVTSLAWASDDLLVYLVQYEDGAAMYSLDPQSGSVDRRIDPAAESHRWSGAAPYGDGLVTMTEHCCDREEEQASVVVVRAATGEVLARMGEVDPDTVDHAVVLGDRVVWVTRGGHLRHGGDDGPVSVVGRAVHVAR